MLQLLNDFPSLLEALNREELEGLLCATRTSEVVVGPEKFRHHRMPEARIVSDSCEYHGADAVFPLHPESLFLSLSIPPAPSGGLYLDVGCGSGVLPVTAARRGWRAHGIDVNRRALALSHVSAKLSGVDLHLTEADIRTFDTDQVFDFVTINMPFEPTGGIGNNFIHSDGGILGNELNEAALKRLPKLLAEEGRAVLISFSLVRDRTSTLENWLKSTPLAGLRTRLLKLSGELALEPLLWRYGAEGRGRVATLLRDLGYATFVIEAAAVARTADSDDLETLSVPLAHPNWIYPIGEHTLTAVS